MNNDNTFNRKNIQSLGEIIQQYIRQSGIQPKLDEATIIKNWEETVGKMIARHTSDIYIKKRKLFVKFDSPALKQEMAYAKTKLLENVNGTIGHKGIEEIILL